MYSRACLSRIVALVVALSLTAVSTGLAARRFRAADAHGEAPDRSNVAVAPIGIWMPGIDMPVDAAHISHHRRCCNSVGFEAAMAGIDAKSPRDATAARPIERIRKVE